MSGSVFGKPTLITYNGEVITVDGEAITIKH